MLRRLLLIPALLITLSLTTGCGALIDESVARRAAETQGFTDVRVVKKDIWFIELRGGSRDDDVRFTVEATNPAGKRVTIYVFAGWPWKGATIRTR